MCNKCNSNSNTCSCNTVALRYNGPNIECAGITSGITMEAAIQTLAESICDIEFEDGADGADGADGFSEVLYGNVLWVDIVNGNDGTGLLGRFDKPFQTYAGARAVAVSGQTIWIRPGNYVENIVLKDGVNVHCDNGVVIFGGILDAGVTTTSKFTGNANITYTLVNTISITGNNSYILINCNNISSTNTAIHINPGVENTSTTIINCNKIFNTTTNYHVTIRSGANLYLNVKESMETQASTNAFTSISTNITFSGKLFVKVPKIIIGNSTNNTAGIFFGEDGSSTALSRVFIEVDEVTSSYDFAELSQIYGTISKQGEGLVDIRVKRLSCIARTGITLSGDTPNGLLVFEGHIDCSEAEAVRHASNCRAVFKNSTLNRGSGGVDSNRVVVLGNPVGATNFGGLSDDIKIELLNCIITKTSIAVGADEIVITDGPTSTILVKDCDIIGINVDSGSPAFDGSVGEANIYFRNSFSNLSQGANVIPLEVSGVGFTGVDVNLSTLDVG